MNPDTVQYSSQNCKLYVHGGSLTDAVQTWQLQLKGASWFGFEGKDGCLHGLWASSLDFLLDFLQNNKFNALRIPVSAELLLNQDTFVPISTVINYSQNPNLQGLKSMQIMDLLVQGAAKRGILVLFDLHCLAASNTNIDPLWYDSTYSEEQVKQAWANLAQRYSSAWNIVGYDLKNEPHGNASWGDGNQSTDWRLAATRLGEAVLKVNFKPLIFVEGVETNAVGQSVEPHFWGGNLDAAITHPVLLSGSNLLKLVYSPHVYGPDVFVQSYFSDPNFPNNMPDIWIKQWAKLFVGKTAGPAVVIGEWGGKMLDGSLDKVWHFALSTFLLDHKQTNQFYWCLNDNSKDTGGLVQKDWKTPNVAKLELLDLLVPSPTKFSVGTDGKITIVDQVPVTSGVTVPVPPTIPPPPPPPPPPPTGTLTPDDALTLFKDLYQKLHDPLNGYFSEKGIPYHTNIHEPIINEAPEYGKSFVKFCTPN